MTVGPGMPGFLCYRRVDSDWRSLSLSRSQWADPARRALYLLRDVEQPISFDKNVLPFAEEPEADGIELIGAVFSTPAMMDDAVMAHMGQPLDELAGGATDWTFAGFDVCDLDGTSGLMNCGYEPDEASLAAAWHDRLNRHHLLVDLAAATEFRELTDLRVKEHAPFLVYAIFCRGVTW